MEQENAGVGKILKCLSKHCTLSNTCQTIYQPAKHSRAFTNYIPKQGQHSGVVVIAAASQQEGPGAFFVCRLHVILVSA